MGCQAFVVGSEFSKDAKIGAMKKDTRLTFRVKSSLKKNLEAVAATEGRSVAQICEVFLKAGMEVYKKEGSKYVQRHLAQRQPKKSEE